MAVAHKAFEGMRFSLLYFWYNSERNVFSVKYFMFEETCLFITSPRYTSISEGTLKARKKCDVFFT